jgi:hypothetical protein
MSNHEDRYLLCDVCDGAFHAHCLRPQMASIPKNGWKCKVRSTIGCSCRTRMTLLLAFAALSKVHGLWFPNAWVRTVFSMARQLLRV